MQYVTMNIENIQVGDLVYSYDTETGKMSLKPVTDVFVRESDHVNYLTISDENGNEQIIETTDGHPFWVVTDDPDKSRAARSVVDENGVVLYHEDVTPTQNGYWVEAKDLREVDVFLGANGELSTLQNKERIEYQNGITAYNFTVDGNHDYYVIAQGEYGESCILVHNAIFYHGTDSNSAKSIAAKGLNASDWKKAGTEIDTKSFSLTKDSDIAAEYAKYRALERGGTPVVLQTDDSVLPKLHTDDLYADPGEVFIKPKDFRLVGPGIFNEAPK